MSKRKVNKGAFNFLKQELQAYADQDLISKEQMSNILSIYTIENRFNFVRVLLLIGSLLVGLGILSFVASNWQYMGNPLRFSLILALFLGVNLASYKLEEAYPKLAQSLLYIGVLTFGAGIFLIGQMFHFGGHFTGAFLMWGLGILPMAVIFREKLIYLYAHILLMIYLNGHLDLEDYPYFLILLVPLLYYLNSFYNYSRLGTFFNNLMALNTIAYFGFKLDFDGLYVVLALFITGLVFYFAPIRFNREVFRLQGNLLIGVMGLILTIEAIWLEPFYKFSETGEVTSSLPTFLMIAFSIAYLILSLLLVKKKNLISLVFVCLTIFRFYVDTMFSFMPKSIFFITGGLILLGFGYYFERLRKEKGGIGYDG